MKIILLFIIKIYWLTIPKNKRRQCIFRKSCSNYVFEITSKEGLIKGLKALLFRISNCRHGFEIFKNPENDKVQMILPNQQVIDEIDIAKRLL